MFTALATKFNNAGMARGLFLVAMRKGTMEGSTLSVACVDCQFLIFCTACHGRVSGKATDGLNDSQRFLLDC